MPYQITTRVFSRTEDLSPEEVAQFIDWVWKARDINCFDMDVMKYPRTVVVSADDNDGALLYMPIQPALMLESLAPRPGVSPRKEAMALWKIGETLEQISKHTGIQEQYFLCKDDRVANLCARHGFEEMKGYRLLKKKIPLPVSDPPKE